MCLLYDVGNACVAFYFRIHSETESANSDDSRVWYEYSREWNNSCINKFTRFFSVLKRNDDFSHFTCCEVIAPNGSMECLSVRVIVCASVYICMYIIMPLYVRIRAKYKKIGHLCISSGPFLFGLSLSDCVNMYMIFALLSFSFSFSFWLIFVFDCNLM